jgi:hypothetical protein
MLTVIVGFHLRFLALFCLINHLCRSFLCLARRLVGKSDALMERIGEPTIVGDGTSVTLLCQLVILKLDEIHSTVFWEHNHG